MVEDGDGKVSLVEYQDWLSYGFDAMDKNRNGVLEVDELAERHDGGVFRDAQVRARLKAKGWPRPPRCSRGA